MQDRPPCLKLFLTLISGTAANTGRGGDVPTQFLYPESICGLCIQIRSVFVFLCPSAKKAEAA